jgi:benzylsuccinate CoA-transferase BbsF subunit
MADLVAHPHLVARGAIADFDHPKLGRVRSLAPPIRLDGAPPRRHRGAPLLGEESSDGARGFAPRSFSANRPGVSWREPAKADHASALPLAGLRVANFGWGLVGPTAGQLLAFLGADVYKIESRVRPDIQRTIPPFFEGVPDPDRSIQNHAFWAGNRSVTLNLKTDEGRALAGELVARCDVVIENFGHGAMERLGLGPEALCARDPRLVFASLSSAGQAGPLSRLRTYGNSLAALAGLDGVTGEADGRLQAMENAYADPLGGVIGALAILVALASRSRTGRGQHLDHSQLEGVLQLVGPHFLAQVLNGRTAGPFGNRHPLGAATPHGVFPCRGEDRWIAIAVATDAEWRALSRATAGASGLDEPGFATLAGRLAGLERLHARIADWTRGFERDVLAARLQAEGVAASPVCDVADLLDHPHYRARGTFVETRHPLGFEETIYGAYVKCSRTRPAIRPGPSIGQDNELVLREVLGLSTERIASLAAKGVIR